jgi:hypothetical protein
LLLDWEVVISTQRSTSGSFWTACAPLGGAKVAFAEAEGERVVEGERVAEELFFGSAELDGVAFFGAAVVAPLADLVAVTLGFTAALGFGCGFVV